MRFAIFSDVHANLEALAAAKDAMMREDVDMFICLGDTVGYGGSPDECCTIVRNLASITVVGNHDAAVAGKMDYNYYYDAARSILDEHRKLLSKKNLRWLRSLPYTYNLFEHEIKLCHGSPINPELFDYVFEIEHAQKLIDIYDALPLITFIGHSHLYRCYVIEPDEVYEIMDSTIKLTRNKFKYLVSVGSVGQPRDMDNRAGYIIYDTSEKEIRLNRVEYDIETASERILKINGDRNFSERIILGW